MTPINWDKCRIVGCRMPPAWIGTWNLRGHSAEGEEIAYCEEHYLEKADKMINRRKVRSYEEIMKDFYTELNL